jgi:hypothetical protein
LRTEYFLLENLYEPNIVVLNIPTPTEHFVGMGTSYQFERNPLLNFFVFTMNINSIVSNVGMLMACGEEIQEMTRSLARKISQVASGSRGLSVHSAAKTSPQRISGQSQPAALHRVSESG